MVRKTKKRRFDMFKIMDLLRLHFEAKESMHQIALSLNISSGSVFRYLEIIKKNGIKWPLDSSFDEKKIMELFKKKREKTFKTEQIPDWNEVEKELSRPHVTRQLLWEEYKEKDAKGLSRSSYFEKLRSHLEANDVDFRVSHKAGEKLYVDYSGDSVLIYNRNGGEPFKAELFVCVWGLSNYCYFEFSQSQKFEDWIKSHVNAFNYFNCAPKYLVPDNLKSAVLKANFYDPELNPTYNQMANFYNCCVIPGRSRRPKDKAIVENHVLTIQRFVLARIRDKKFFSIEELNQATRDLLLEFNDKNFQKKPESRKIIFETLDKPAATKLPANDFEFMNIATGISIGKNYHVLYKKHYYSVHFSCYKGGSQKVRVFEKYSSVEIYLGQERLAMHQKGSSDYSYTTNVLHMPERHKFFACQNKESLIQEASEIGESVSSLVTALLNDDSVYEKNFRIVLGILKLKNEYSKNKINNAAKIVGDFEGSSLKLIIKILENTSEEVSSFETENIKQINHENIRGQEAFQSFK